MKIGDNFTPQLTADGSFTFFSSEFGETFHSHHGAVQEAQLKFVEPTHLSSKAGQKSLRVLDICYGLGYNTAAALATIWAANPNCRVEWIGLESDISVPKQAIAHRLLNNWSQPIADLLVELATSGKVETDRIQARLIIGDARSTIQQVRQSGFLADAIFLDPFSPPSCPQLWTVEFIAQVASCCAETGRIATYSCAASVRSALLAARLNIGSTPPVGRRSPGTVASFSQFDNPSLSLQEQEHLQTRAAIPYRDPHLNEAANSILSRRRIEQEASSLEPTSRWKKRWLSL